MEVYNPLGGRCPCSGCIGFITFEKKALWLMAFFEALAFELSCLGSFSSDAAVRGNSLGIPKSLAPTATPSHAFGT